MLGKHIPQRTISKPLETVCKGDVPGASVLPDPGENSRLEPNNGPGRQEGPSVAGSSEEPELIVNIWHPASHPSSQQDSGWFPSNLAPFLSIRPE